MRIVFHGQNAAAFSDGFAALVGRGRGCRYPARYIGLRCRPGGVRQLPRSSLARGSTPRCHGPGRCGCSTCRGPAMTRSIWMRCRPGWRCAIVSATSMRSPSMCWRRCCSVMFRWPMPTGGCGRATGPTGPGRRNACIRKWRGRCLVFWDSGISARRWRRARWRSACRSMSPTAARWISELVDRAYGLADLARFWGSVDSIVVTLPLVPETRGIVGADAFAQMRSDAVLINVARGPVVDEQALYDALNDNRIAGAVIDTWYQYPEPGQSQCMPSKLPFHALTKYRHDPAHVGLDRRNDPAATAGDGGKYPAPDARRCLRQRCPFLSQKENRCRRLPACAPFGSPNGRT